MLARPVIATRSCGDCQKWWYVSHDSNEINNRGGLDLARTASEPTPCGTCPKKSPEEARHYELSQRNVRAYLVYQRVRAMGAGCLTKRERMDAKLQRNLAIIDGIIRRHEASSQAAKITEGLIAAMTATGGPKA